jgi:hypothetical protein
MSDVVLPGSIEPAARKGPDLTGAFNPLTAIIFAGVIAAALLYVAYSITLILTRRTSLRLRTFPAALRRPVDCAWL